MTLKRCVVFVFLSVAGCGEQPLPPAADPGRARAALNESLDAWQKGETSESFKARSPAIYFNDPDWNRHTRLLKYDIESEEANALSWRCRVVLTVQSNDGKPQRRQASYIIDTGTAVVIVRDSMK